MAIDENQNELEAFLKDLGFQWVIWEEMPHCRIELKKDGTVLFNTIQSCKTSCLRASVTWVRFHYNFADLRPGKIDYAMRLAVVTATRSEDPFYKVGAVAMDVEGRIVATGYNGLPHNVDAARDWWLDKETRKPFVLHAEQNLCSHFKRGEVSTVCVTLMPCVHCMQVLAAHGVKHVYFKQEHASSAESVALAEFWGMTLEHWEEKPI